MKISKKPSIFSDRSGIGSSDELDEYGVWVKIEPDDLFDDSENAGSLLNSADDFDIGAEISDEPEGLQSFDIDFSSGAPEIGGDEELSAQFDDSIPEGSLNADALDFEGFTEEDAPAMETEPGEEINESDIFGDLEDDQLQIKPDFAPAAEAEAEIEMESAEIAPENIDLDTLDAEFDTPELAADSFDLPGDDGGEAAALDTGEGSFDVDFELEGHADLELDQSPMEQMEQIEQIDENDFSQIPETIPQQAAKTPAAEGGNVATELLLKIASELSVIKTELDDLKTEISSLKGDGSAAYTPPAMQEEPAAIDEDVALTGDELNDVLNNADLTHETAESTADFNEDDIVLSDADIALDDISADNETNEANEALEESISVDDTVIDALDSEPENDESISLTLDELDNLKDEDDSISLTGDELDKLNDVDDSIALTADELTVLNNVEDDAVPQDAGEAEALAGDEPGSLDDGSAAFDLAMETEADDGAVSDPELSKLADEGFDLPADDIPLDFEVELDMGSSDEADDALIMPDDIPAEAAGEAAELEVPALAEEDPGAAADPFDLDAGEDFNLDEGAGIVEADVAAADAGQDDEPVFDAIDDIVEGPDTLSAQLAENELVPVSAKQIPESALDEKFKNEIRTVLAYMDQLLESLPENKIEEFARSDKFEVYKKVFKDLGLV